MPTPRSMPPATSSRSVSKYCVVRADGTPSAGSSRSSSAARPCTRRAIAVEPARAVVHRVKPGNVCQQRLRRADVRRRLLAADVLLARLQRHAVRAVALRIHRHADDAPRRLAHVALERREKCRVRSAISERHAEALRVSVDDIRAELAGRRQESEAQQIRSDRDQDAGALRVLDERAEVVHRAGFVRRLHERAECAVAERRALDVADDELDAQRFRSAAQDFQRLRKARRGDEELRGADDAVDPFALDAVQERHRFGRCGRFVEQRRVRDAHGRQIAHHGLKIQEPFEPALGDLGLVWSVRCVPAGVFEHVAEDDARRDAVVVAEADEGPEDLVARGHLAQVAQELVLRLMPAGRFSGCLSRMRAGTASSISASRDGRTDHLQHRVAFGVVWADVSGLKLFGIESHLLHEILILRGVEQRAGLGRVAQLDRDHPGSVRIDVDRPRACP